MRRQSILAVAMLISLPLMGTRTFADLSFQGLGDLPGGSFGSRAYGVSADGSVVVGGSRVENEYEAFRWTSAGGMVGLGDLPGGGVYSIARDVSADGSVVVGYSASASGGEAFRWTLATGMVGLGDLPGGSFYSSAEGISADGSVVVGQSYTESGLEAFIWNQTDGMQNLQDMLVTDYSLDLTGWHLEHATAISDDGLTIVGHGINPDGNEEAWLATLWESLVADAGGPYFLDIGDPPIMLGGSVIGGYSQAAWDLDADGFFDDAFGLNPLISSDMLTSWGFSPGMTWDIGLQVTNLFGGVDTSMTQLTFVPLPGAALLGLLGLSAAGLGLRRWAC